MPEWLPHHSVDFKNPLFRYELRRVFDASTLSTHTIRWFLWGISAPLLFWLIYTIYLTTIEAGWPQSSAYGDFWNYLLWLFGASLADKLVIDFIAVAAGLRNFSRDLNPRQWDLISLTNLSSQQVITAKHAVAQIHTWRMMCISIGFRSGIICAFVLHAFLTSAILSRETINLSFYSFDESIAFILSITALLVLIAGYVFEPRWRIRTLTAGGIAVVSQRLSPTFQIVAGLGAIVGLWMTQATIAGLIVGAYILIINSGIFFSYITPIMIAFIILMFAAFMFAITYFGYQLLGQMWLRNTYRRMLTNGGNP